MKKYALHNYLFLCLAVLCLFFTGCEQAEVSKLVRTQKSSVPATEKPGQNVESAVSIEQLPEYEGEPYVVINGNQPHFTGKEKKKKSFERYSKLDSMGRCGAAFANIGKDLMPTEKRGNIGTVRPTGWSTVKYGIVEGRYLYNRCHLIGYQLTAENANKRNLITGTRYMNVEGMLPFENMVADYVEETDNHVLYRVTPVFEGENLVANGVQMEAYSVEDKGEGICFNVFVYNVQPGIYIDYTTGESKRDSGKGTAGKKTQKAGNTDEDDTDTDTATEQVEIHGNRKSKIYHCPGQASYEEMADSPNLIIFHSEKEAVSAGYRKAKR